jgi:hypothetical protein
MLAMGFWLAAQPLGGAACDTATNLLSIPIEFTYDIQSNIDVAKVTGTEAGKAATAAAVYDVSSGAIAVDLASANTQIADNRSKLKSVEFPSITVTLANNTLTSATPAADLYVGPKGATTIAEAVKVASIASIPAGSSAAVSVTIDTAGQTAAQPHLLSLDFVVLVSVPELSVAIGELVPDGKDDLTIRLNVKAVLNPT